MAKGNTDIFNMEDPLDLENQNEKLSPKQEQQGFAQEPPDDSFLAGLDFIKFLIVARKNLIWVLLILVLAVGSAYLYLRYTKPIYESITIIKLDPKRESKMLGLDRGGNSFGNSMEVNLQGELELIKSNRVYQSMIDILDMNINYFSSGSITFEENYQRSTFVIENYEVSDPSFYDRKILLNIDRDNVWKLSYFLGKEEISTSVSSNGEANFNGFKLKFKDAPSKNTTQPGDYFFTINSRDALCSYIDANLVVLILNANAGTIKMSFKDFNPLKARDVIAAVDSIYFLESLKKKKITQEQMLLFLDNQLVVTQRKVDSFETMIENFAISNKTYDVRELFGKSIDAIEKIHETKAMNSLKIKMLTQVEESIENNKEYPKLIYYLGEAQEGFVSSLLSSLLELQKNKNKLKSMVKETSSIWNSKKSEVAELESTIKTLIFENKNKLSKENYELESQIAEYERVFMSIPSKDNKINKIKRSYGIYDRYYNILVEKKAESGMNIASMVPEFIILQKPTLPGVPISPVHTMVYSIAFLVGFFLALLLIIFKYFIHNTINNLGELQKLVRAPILGSIPLYELEKMNFSRLVIDKNPKSTLSESFRSIRTNLEFMIGYTVKNKKFISVTSTVSGEGKTFIALNLAGIIAYSGQKVVVIDLDMRKPKIHLSFDTPNDKGMSTILINKNTIEECVFKTQIPTLDFIPSGPIPPNPSELILSSELDVVLKKLGKLYDFVVIDTPPVGLVTDGIMVLRKVDLPIYVVRAEYSKIGYERNIYDLVNKFGCRNLSVILNGFRNLSGYGYGYKYGYYGKSYGYYSDDKKTSIKSLWERLNKKKK